jgi:hypothetical protein
MRNSGMLAINKIIAALPSLRPSFFQENVNHQSEVKNELRHKRAMEVLCIIIVTKLQCPLGHNRFFKFILCIFNYYKSIKQ